MYPGFTDLHYAGLAHYENENYRQAEYVFKQCISMGDAPVPPFVSLAQAAEATRQSGLWEEMALPRACMQLAGNQAGL